MTYLPSLPGQSDPGDCLAAGPGRAKRIPAAAERLSPADLVTVAVYAAFRLLRRRLRAAPVAAAGEDL